MRSIRSVYLLGAALLVISLGCSAMSPEKKLVGTWKGEIKMGEPTGAAGMDALAKGLGAMMSADLELKEDKTFKLTMLLFPIEGTWSLSGNKVEMVPTKVMGLTADDAKKMAPAGMKVDASKGSSRPMYFEASADWTTLTGVDDKGVVDKRGGMVFTKNAVAKG